VELSRNQLLKKRNPTVERRGSFLLPFHFAAQPTRFQESREKLKVKKQQRVNTQLAACRLNFNKTDLKLDMVLSWIGGNVELIMASISLSKCPARTSHWKVVIKNIFIERVPIIHST